MAHYIVFNRHTDLAAVSARAREGLNPRHSMAALADALGAVVPDGSKLKPGLAATLLGKLTRTLPWWWEVAYQLRAKARPGDVIYCTGEDIGTVVATVCGKLPGIKIAVMAHYIDRQKGRLAIRLFGLGRKVALFCAVAKPQADFLKEFLRASDNRVRFVWDQTDTNFFSPGPTSPDKARPVVMSIGLEQRDYATLAAATTDMDIDVRISGYSPDTKLLQKAFPAEMPANMSRRFYSWPDLLQLYRDADIVVVSLFPNDYAAGVQGLMEAMACGRPVVVTATEGLKAYLDHPEAIRLVPPGDPARLREAIADLLANPEERARMGEHGARIARERHPLERYVETIATSLRGLQGGHAG